MKQSATVIVYHGIGESSSATDSDLFVTREAFEQQMAFLARHREVVPLESVVPGATVRTRRRAVALSFDDGFRSVLTVAAPVLERHGFPATAFVTTRWIDGESAGRDETSGHDLLDEDDVRELRSRGFEIASHGHTHTDLSTLSEAVVEADLRTSRDRIEQITGSAPRYLAWPYGAVSTPALAAAERTGFAAAFTMNAPSAGVYALSRVPVYRPDGLALIALKTSGRYVAVRRSRVGRTVHSIARRAARRSARPA